MSNIETYDILSKIIILILDVIISIYYKGLEWCLNINHLTYLIGLRKI